MKTLLITLKMLLSSLWIVMVFSAVSCSKDSEFIDESYLLPQEIITTQDNVYKVTSDKGISESTSNLEVTECGSLALISKPNLKMVHLEYISSEDLENAIVEITMPQITSFVNGPASQGFIFTPNNHDKPTVVTWEGNLTACVKKTFCIIVEPDCNVSGKAIIWSDFKVSGVSVKGSIKNKVFDCR
ncbi:MAG: hypothetical protein IBX66_03395 [Lutibacter sp.]|nr:hypothetical protein [Lutibacter sp.]